MNRKTTFWTVIVLIAVVIFVWWFYSVKGITITDDYDTKVVYTTNLNEDEVPYRNDCRERKGTFNSCGNPCDPEGSICAQVCAYTCDNIPTEDNGSNGDDNSDGEDNYIGNELIRAYEPAENAVIESPVTISGNARGTWFFEASFSAVLVDWNGRIIAQGPVMAEGEWMTEEFVTFESSLEFTSPYTEGDPDFYKRGTIILQKANPSGLPENEDAVEIPVRFSN
ncbi:MAG: hypothetical protein COV70_02500 [Parcubacteria group bacterium CG11_big_fil_rev_8_21_14_0_20_39_22]|nr:MAG: hypothetical protein COV70_02500 [Parcubacteria group bacterium CG11_big_fil_rev_8_21_14_0_20_39_22]